MKTIQTVPGNPILKIILMLQLYQLSPYIKKKIIYKWSFHSNFIKFWPNQNWATKSPGLSGVCLVTSYIHLNAVLNVGNILNFHALESGNFRLQWCKHCKEVFKHTYNYYIQEKLNLFLNSPKLFLLLFFKIFFWLYFLTYAFTKVFTSE